MSFKNNPGCGCCCDCSTDHCTSSNSTMNLVIPTPDTGSGNCLSSCSELAGTWLLACDNPVIGLGCSWSATLLEAGDWSCDADKVVTARVNFWTSGGQFYEIEVKSDDGVEVCTALINGTNSTISPTLGGAGGHDCTREFDVTLSGNVSMACGFGFDCDFLNATVFTINP